MKKTRQWAPNPYAIAQLLLDVLDIEPVYEASGEGADNFLRRAFNAKGEKTTLAEAVELFQKLAVAVGRPMSTAQVLELAEAKRIARLFAVEQIRRVLPYLVPLLDAEFAPTWFRDAGQLMIDEASYLDPIQGAVSDCYSDIGNDRSRLGQTTLLGGRLALSKIQSPGRIVFRVAVP